MGKEEVIEKIQKLMALSTSSNEHEAELAAKKAAELLAKYDLEMMDVIAKKRGEANSIDMINSAFVEEYNQGNFRWEGVLIASITKVFDCAVVRWGGSDKFQVYGTKSDLELLLYFFRYLRLRISTDVRKYQKREAYSYAVGFVGVVKKRMEMIYQRKKEVLEKDNSNVRDLVLFKKKYAEEAMHNEHKHIVKSQSAPKINRNTYVQGQVNGSKVPLSRPIEGNGGGQKQIR